MDIPLLMTLEAARSLARERVFRTRQNPFELEEIDFVNMYRVNKRCARWLTEVLRQELSARRYTKATLAVEEKILIALNFYARGSFQQAVGDSYSIPVSQGSVSVVIHAVTKAIVNKLFNKVVRYPESLTDIKFKYYEACRLPNVIGSVDCTHIHLKAPHLHPEAYINRKGRHSINVQLVCTADLIVRDVVAKWPGSSHDSSIWHASSLRDRLQRQADTNLLLGDMGYPLEPWLMTPLPEPRTPPEVEYNKRHQRGRNIIERVNGVLKSRFRCLDLSGGVLQYKPEMVCRIVAACVVLHNICITKNIPLPATQEELWRDDTGDSEPTATRRRDGRAERVLRELISLC